MQIERETTFGDAIESIAMLLQQMRDSRISVGDRQVGPADRVTLEIEIESSDGRFELEFEIKWRAPVEHQEHWGEG